MPLGISERKIERAYGPFDLGGVYKNIFDASRRVAEEDKARDLLLKKEYYTNVASLNKEVGNVRAKDNPEIMKDYNDFKRLSTLAMSDKRLSTEERSRLEGEANASYTSAIQKARASKEKMDRLKRLTSSYYANPKKFKDTTPQLLSKLGDMTTQEIDSYGLDDDSNFIYQGPDFKEVNDSLAKIQKTPKAIARVNEYADDKAGVTVYSDYEIPNVTAIQSNISNFLARPSQDIKSIMDMFEPQYQSIRQEYESIPDEAFANFKTPDGKEDKFPLHISPITGKPTRKPDLNFDTKNDAERLNVFLLARSLNQIKDASPAKGQQNKTEFAKGEIGKAELKNKLAIDLFNKLEPIRQRNREALQRGSYDYRSQLAKVDKEMEMKLRLLSGLVGSEAKLGIQYGDELTNETIDSILGKLQNISEKVKPAVVGKGSDKKKIKGF